MPRLITGADLPEIGWSGRNLSYERFRPPTPTSTADTYTKPRTGGLWCSPVRRIGLGKYTAGTWWSGYAAYTEVHPAVNAVVALVDNRQDLLDLIAAFPDRRPVPDIERTILGNKSGQRVDWPRAAKHIDAVYVTHNGLQASKNRIGEEHLWGWDVPTVLFLTPAFVPGRVRQPQPLHRPDRIPKRVRRRLYRNARRHGTDPQVVKMVVDLLRGLDVVKEFG